MEGESSDLIIEIQRLETKWTKMLENVKPPEINDFDRQCIFRVPQKIRESNPKAYTPQIISIGPYHKACDVGKEDNIFEVMEEFKLKYLKGFLNRTQVPIRDFIVKLKELEERIRYCYSEPIKYDSDDFLNMILVDACFIIEFFIRCGEFEYWVEKDPLFLKPSFLTDMQQDLILIENQLPFFVLEELYDLTSLSQEFPSILDITCNLFKGFGFGSVYPKESPKHFTDLLRSFAISSSKLDLETSEEYHEINHVYSASQLMEAGLKFRVNPNAGLLDLTYSKQEVLIMPSLSIHDGTETLFRNVMAYEECHVLSTKIITEYVAILDFLINTEKDVNILVDKKIIVNWTGDANKVVKMINNLSSYLSMPNFNSQYLSMCNSLNDFYENPRNKYKAIFIHEYFNTPWKIASTTAAVVLLLLTLIQTICSIISLVQAN